MRYTWVKSFAAILHEGRMGKQSAAFDAYIAKAPPFARPILEKLRRLFHQACPDIEETMKWSAPHFEYNGVVAGMAAFKAHIRFGFWKGKLLGDPFTAMPGSSGSMARITDASQLPPDQVLVQYIRRAVALNEQGIKSPARKKRPRPELKAPDYFMCALAKNKKALATFQAFSPTNKREYVEWVTEAKQEATREKRLATAIEWMAQGKPRNWKYMNCKTKK
jgi:hypothetical protein